ncbi:MAG: hypothetical protein DRI61_10090 [Chloroflexi bacterium]|nr:MAG: hypothetical protein DRI61_10090 [Chloroflexota bacterium]
MRKGLLPLFFAIGCAFAIALFSRASQEVRVKGHILDAEDNHPIPAARLTWDGEILPITSSGEFHITTKRGVHYLSIKAPGYWRWKGQVKVAYFSFNPKLVIHLKPKILRGQVFDKLDRVPIPGAKVQVNDVTLTADSYGHFALERAEPPLKLKVQADGYIPWEGTVPSDNYLLSPVEIFLEPNVITGKIMDALSGEPLAQARIHTDDWEATSDGNGYFTLRRVLTGEEISATAQGYIPRIFYFNGKAPLELLLQPRLAYITVWEKLTGRPLPGAEVQFRGQKFDTDALGKASLKAPVLGEHITISAPYHLPLEIIFEGQEEIYAELSPTFWQGRLTDSSEGKPVTDALIYVNNTVLTVGEDGLFTLANVPESSKITIKAPGYALLHLDLAQPTGPGGWEIKPCSPFPCLNVKLEPFKVKGIYIPFVLLDEPERVWELVELVDKTELNAIVVDVKSDRGFLAFPSQVPLAKELGVVKEKEAQTLQKLLELCKEKGIYIIARMVIFKDHPLATGHPELAVKRGDGTIWIDREKLGWGNPFREEVWEYNIELAKEVAALGFDEIQFDYIRFPSDGDLSAIVYEEPNTRETRTKAIREFIARMAEALRPFPVFTSVDVFGLTVWVEKGGDMGIGQRVEDVSPYVDYLCPMVYPSTFALGALGYDNPALYPYEVVYRSTIEARKRSAALVRPWLQHYSLYGVTYDLERLQAQKQAAEDAEAWGWTFWNAGGVYNEKLFSSGLK